MNFRDTTLSSRAGVGHTVDDALHKHHMCVEVARDTGQKLGNEVVDGRSGKADAVAFSISREMRLLSGHIKIRNGDVGDRTEEFRVIERFFRGCPRAATRSGRRNARFCVAC